MITVTEVFQIDSGIAPFTYNWSIPNSCMTVDVASGTSQDGTIEAVFTAENEACFPQTVTLYVTDAAGCTPLSTPTFIIANPCTGFTLSAITRAGEYDFVVNSNLDATFQWTFDNNLFEVDDSVTLPGNQLRLKLIGQPVPEQSTSINVIATSENGCVLQESYVIEFEQPLAGDLTISSNCIDNYTATTFYTLPVTSSNPIDWNTLIVNAQNEVTSIQSNDQLRLTAIGLSGVTITVSYTVEDIYGIISTVGEIIWTISVCRSSTRNTGPTTTLPPLNALAANFGVVHDIPFSASKEYDLSQSAFIPTAGQSVDPTGLILTTPNSELILQVDNITFEQTNAAPGCESDCYQVQLVDQDGVAGRIAQGVVVFDQIPAPTITDKEICSQCEAATPYLPLYRPDLGDELIDETSLELVGAFTAELRVLYSLLGAISYEQDIKNNAASDSATHRFYSLEGVPSNNFDVLVNRICAGFFTSTVVDITCSSPTFNLESLLNVATSYHNTITWSEVNAADPNSYTTQGGSITSNPGAGGVDFTAINPGTYIFRATVSNPGATPGYQQLNCPSEMTADVTIILQDTPAFAIVPPETLVSTGIYRIDYTIEGVASSSNIAVSCTPDDPTIVIPPSIVGGVGSVTVQLASGNQTVQIDATNICAGVMTDTIVISVP